MNNGYKGFKDLNCWKEGCVLRREISALAKTFPAHEKFMLYSQIIRSSRSITNNIAEGYGRFHYTDTRHFFIQSRGSVTETIDHLTIAYEEGYVTEGRLQELEGQCEKVFRLINGYIHYLDKEQKPSAKPPITNS